MDNKNDEKLPIAPAIKALEINETVTFPVERLNAVRSTATQLGLQHHKSFTCSVSDDRTTITVKRTA